MRGCDTAGGFLWASGAGEILPCGRYLGLAHYVTDRKRSIIGLICSGTSSWQKCPDPTVCP